MQTRMYVLHFAQDIIEQPIICLLVKQFDVEFNILQASINLREEGMMVLELMGYKKNIGKAVAWLQEQGVSVDRLAACIHRDEEKCFQCGACTGICTTGALAIRRPEMAVLFDAEKCTGCGLCVPVCPVRAMAVSVSRTMERLAE